MRAPRALGRSGEAAHFVSRAAGSARRGGSHLRCMVTANRLWFLRKASARTALLAATVTSYVAKSTLAGQSGRFAFAECPGARSDSPNIDDWTSMRIRAARVQGRPYQRKDNFMNKGTVKVTTTKKASASFNRMMAVRPCSSTPPHLSAPGLRAGCRLQPSSARRSSAAPCRRRHARPLAQVRE